MNKKKKNLKWLIIVEVIIFYFTILNVVSHARGPIQYTVDADSPLLKIEDFTPLSSEQEKFKDDLKLINSAQGIAVGYIADLELTNLDDISVNFQINCPDEVAGGTLFIDLCNGELGYDNPEQEYSLQLAAGVNNISCQINKGETAPSEAQFRIFTLDKANFSVEQLKVEKAIPAPSVTQPMILAIIISGIILVITIAVEYWRKHQICTQNDIRG